MKVAIDATYSLGDDLSGVGVYSRELLAGVAAAHPETDFHFCYRPHRFLRSLAEPLPRNAHRRLLQEPLAGRSAALFHGLNQRLPRFPMRRAVATFHDLFVLTGDYSTAEFRARFAAQARDAAARADRIVAVSAFTASQVTQLLGVDPRKIRVIHHGVRQLPPVEVNRQPVILSVGALQKRKNVTRLVEAFETVDPPWRLVLAGAAGYGAEEILARIERSPARNRIEVAGYVGLGELAAAYARASIFAFPSLDEGFGMPVLEAMAAGLPVLTSSRSAMPEVAGDAACLVDPEDTDGIAQALRELAGNQDLRAELAARGLKRSRLFTWEKTVRETWDVYLEVLG